MCVMSLIAKEEEGGGLLPTELRWKRERERERVDSKLQSAGAVGG